MALVLTAKRFVGFPRLQQTLNDPAFVVGSPLIGDFVKAIQESLLAQAYPLPLFGADGPHEAFGLTRVVGLPHEGHHRRHQQRLTRLGLARFRLPAP